MTNSASQNEESHLEKEESHVRREESNPRISEESQEPALLAISFCPGNVPDLDNPREGITGEAIRSYVMCL